MKIIFWTIVAFISLIIGATELVYARYVAGEEVGEYTLFDDGAPTRTEIEISEEDFPVRFNLTMFGARDTNDLFSYSKVSISTGGPNLEDSFSLDMSVDKEDDYAGVSVNLGNITLRPTQTPVRVERTHVIESATPGTWVLSAAVSGEQGFEMRQINAVVRINSRSVNWEWAGPALGVLLISFIMLVQALRSRFPEAAS